MWDDLAVSNVGALLTLPDQSDTQLTDYLCEPALDGARHFML